MPYPKKDANFFEDAIALLDEGEKYNDITMDMSFPYVTDEDEGLERLQEEREHLGVILDLLPKRLLNMPTRSKGIQKIFQEEIFRRQILSIKKKDDKQTKHSSVKRRIL